MYHEKFGLFDFPDARRAAFIGSANETAGGLYGNFERLDLFCSWLDAAEERRISGLELDFRRLRADNTPGLEVLDLVEAVRRGVFRNGDTDKPSTFRTDTRGSVGRNCEALIPLEVPLWRHQSRAIESWGNAGGRGILEMATGSGKTLAALTLCSRVYDRVGAPFCIVIVAPLIHLVDQWLREASRFGLRPLRCAESQVGWRDELDSAIFALNSAARPLLSVCVTAATFSGAMFQQLLKRIRRPLLLIADEVHNYGTEDLANCLPENAQFRLGLSATPERWRDSAGTARLLDYFGPPVFRYSLDEAIHDNVLTPYRYYPQVVNFEPEELDNYIELTSLIARYWDDDNDRFPTDAVKSLLIRRARIVASASGKLPRLAQLLARDREATHILVYCGDGSVEGPTPDATLRQVDAAVRLIGGQLRMRCASYTAMTSPRDRRRLLADFEAGFIQALVAIRCLDEGVDIPAARRAYILASSTNPKQFIQRRGRVLRRAAGKTRADIYDFFVAPCADTPPRNSPLWSAGRSLLRTQIRRAREFADAAINGPAARQPLVRLASDFDLLSHWEESLL